MKTNLNGCWSLGFTRPDTQEFVTFPAKVPGNVEIELMENGLISDPMPADNEHATTLYNSVDDWTYCKTFDAVPCKDNETQEIVFEGIDTIADIYLNGEKLAHAEDMFVSHRVDVTGKLKTTGNELKLIIRSAMLWAKKQDYDIFGISRENTAYGGQPYLRKARHEWGWDNAPRLLTSGIYRDVYIETLPKERFTEVYLYTNKITDEKAELGVIWNYATELPDLRPYSLRLTLCSEGKVAYSSEEAIFFTRGALRFSVPREKIALWWPSGFGKANLCDVKLEMLLNGQVVSEYTAKWGIRTIRLNRTENILEDGTGEFVFVVNNENIYIRGANWKPLDALHSRADAKVEKAIEMVRDLNCNMIRIWGGGIYEGEQFFELCDKLGIMVWQDFMFGCEYPPMDEDYCRIVAEETRRIIVKQRNHASLAVWCGDNEDDETLVWTNPNSTLLPSHNKISRVVLKEAVLRYDPYRDYVESSPFNSDENVTERFQGKKVTHFQPEAHLYPATKVYAETLRTCKGRFIGETGPIAINAMTDDPAIFAREQDRCQRLWDKPMLVDTNRAHQDDDYFIRWRQTAKECCELWFGRDFTLSEFGDYTLAVNLICGDVFKDVIEYCRVNRWEKTGVIWWSLLDMWPMLFNYSVIDCNFKKKLPYYFIKQSQQEFALMAVRQEMGGEVLLYSANDTLKNHCGSYTVTAYNKDGASRVAFSGEFNEPGNTSRILQRISEKGQELLLIEWEENGQRYVNHFITGDKPYEWETIKAWAKLLKTAYHVE